MLMLANILIYVLAAPALSYKYLNITNILMGISNLLTLWYDIIIFKVQVRELWNEWQKISENSHSILIKIYNFVLHYIQSGL